MTSTLNTCSTLGSRTTENTGIAYQYPEQRTRNRGFVPISAVVDD